MRRKRRTVVEKELYTVSFDEDSNAEKKRKTTTFDLLHRLFIDISQTLRRLSIDICHGRRHTYQPDSPTICHPRTPPCSRKEVLPPATRVRSGHLGKPCSKNSQNPPPMRRNGLRARNNARTKEKRTRKNKNEQEHGR